MIHFEGEKTFSRPLPDVAAKLSDVGFLVGCLTDAQVSEVGPDRAVWKLRPKLSFLTGSLEVKLEAVGRDPGKSVTYKVSSRAIGATSTVNVVLGFREADGGTAVPWAGDLVEVTGLLKMVPKGLLQATAQKVIDDVWAAVSEKLTAPPG
jgi:carbon monoxide dehydrogenase subunit G